MHVAGYDVLCVLSFKMWLEFLRRFGLSYTSVLMVDALFLSDHMHTWDCMDDEL